MIKKIDFFNQYNYNVALPKIPEIDELIKKSLNNNLIDDDFKQFEKIFKDKIYNIKDYEVSINLINNEKHEFNKVNTRKYKYYYHY